MGEININQECSLFVTPTNATVEQETPKLLQRKEKMFNILINHWPICMTPIRQEYRCFCLINAAFSVFSFEFWGNCMPPLHEGRYKLFWEAFLPCSFLPQLISL